MTNKKRKLIVGCGKYLKQNELFKEYCDRSELCEQCIKNYNQNIKNY